MYVATNSSCAFILPVTDAMFARVIICLTKCLLSIVSDEENIPVLIKVLLHYIEGAKGNRKRVCMFTFYLVPLLPSLAVEWLYKCIFMCGSLKLL